jgi:polyribonucleotide nucleotidyltransferase
MQWFGKEPRAAAISFELEAIANCAIHPKFLDEAVVSTANVDDMYLNFSDHLHDFVGAVEEKFAADGRLDTSFVRREWATRMGELPNETVAMRIAQVHFQRLVDVLALATS